MLRESGNIEKMEWFDTINMEKAIAEAEKCIPENENLIPKVGAVIAVGDVVLGFGHRGTGAPGDDDHAEMHALRKVVDRTQLAKATLYTTLEPCTPEVRSKPLECCTELIRQAEVSKVFIGTLDPNQGVCGKGILELQSRGIEVELFPPDLAKKIRVSNDKFIRAQRSLGLRFTNPANGSTIRTHDNGGVFEFRGEYVNEPGQDVVAFTNINNHWWPQPHALAVEGKNEWSVKVHFGVHGPHIVSLVRVNDLGRTLVNHYHKMCRSMLNLRKELKERFNSPEDWKFIDSRPGPYHSINMEKLPKGMQLQTSVEIEVEKPNP